VCGQAAVPGCGWKTATASAISTRAAASGCPAGTVAFSVRSTRAGPPARPETTYQVFGCPVVTVLQGARGVCLAAVMHGEDALRLNATVRELHRSRLLLPGRGHHRACPGPRAGANFRHGGRIRNSIWRSTGSRMSGLLANAGSLRLSLLVWAVNVSSVCANVAVYLYCAHTVSQ
jgi:hypothetical protein